MPFINPEDGHLVVLNLFKTDTLDKRDRLLKETTAVVDSAGFPGWVSSTVHRGVDKLGTLNLIQWRRMEDLRSWYAGDMFKHRDMTVFLSLMTFTRLLQTEMVLSQCHPATGTGAEISQDRDDYTAVEILDVSPSSQEDLIAAVGDAHEWLVDTPGYRSQSVLRGVVSRTTKGTEGLQTMGDENSFIVIYSQWDGKKTYDAFRFTPEHEKSPARLASEVKRNAMTISSDWNSYEVVHSRSAA